MRRRNVPVLLLCMVACIFIASNATAGPRSGEATVMFTVTDALSNAPISGIKVVIATDTAPRGAQGCYDCHGANQIGILSDKASRGRYEHKFAGTTDAEGVVAFQVPVHVRILVVVKDPFRMYDLETLERISIRKAVEYRFDVAMDPVPVM